MKNLKFLVFVICLLGLTKAYSQPWMNNIDESNKNPDFYEIQKAFDQYWAEKEYEKGKGFKQFKRWEYFMASRVDKEGYLNPSVLWKEWKDLKNRKNRTLSVDSANWTLMGPDDTPVNINNPGTRRGSGRINCISFHPDNPDKIYAGAPSGGFWKTNDGGNSWTTTTDHLPTIGISDIAVHPDKPDTLYIATGDGDGSDTYSAGVLMSPDGGDSWTQLSLNWPVSNYVRMRRMIINPQNPNIILASSTEGIFRTNDGGNNWTKVISGHFKDLEFKPGNPSVVYAATYNYGGASIYKSVDGGINWQLTKTISSSNRIELAVTPADNAKLYVVASKSSDNGYLGTWRSDDSGQTFNQVHGNSNINLLGWSTDGSDSGGQGWYDLAIAADPDNANVVYVGGVNSWKSVDAGASWNIVTHWYGGTGIPYIHADQHTFDFSPHTGELFSGNDGGIHKTADGGASWTDISDGLQILQIYRMGLSETNSQRLVTGTQDNGTMRYNNGNWHAIVGGDGMECLIDYTNEDIIYGELYYGRIRRSYDGGYSFTDIKPSGTGDGAWVTPYIIDPLDPETLYIGFTDVYKTNNRGNSWMPVSSNLTNGDDILSLAISPVNNDYIYAASRFNIYKTTNGGSSWSKITNNLPGDPINYITVSPADPQEVWVSLGRYNSTGVYHTTNGGATWSDFSNGLPDIPVNCVAYEENTSDALYAGTDLGVFYRNSDTSQWIPYDHGLPNVIVNELEIQYSTGKLRAATYGRGVWESDLYENITTPDADFNYNITNACKGDVYFTSTSSGSPDDFQWYLGNGKTDTTNSNMHTYDSLGSYDVKLVVSNSMGTDSITKQITIEDDSLKADFTSSRTQDCKPGEIEFFNLSDYFESFEWNFGDGNNSVNPNPAHTYQNYGDFDVELIGKSAICKNDTIKKQAFISFDSLNSAKLNMPEKGYTADQVCCHGVLFDNGGEFNNYSDNTNGNVKIMPYDADQLELNFLNFDVEAGTGGSCNYDKISVYEGLIAYSGNLIGEYCNVNPPSGNIITSGGKALINQYTDQGVNKDGFELNWQCLKVDFTYQVDNTNSLKVDFSDISTNYPDSWEWDFDDGNSSTLQHPEHTYSQNGTYNVSLTVTNNQGSYTETKQITVGNVGKTQKQLLSEIEVYPNPADNNYLFIKSPFKEAVKYKIIDQNGRIIKDGKLKSSDKGLTRIIFKRINPGFYNLKFIKGDNQFIKKISIL